MGTIRKCHEWKRRNLNREVSPLCRVLLGQAPHHAQNH